MDITFRRKQTYFIRKWATTIEKKQFYVDDNCSTILSLITTDNMILATTKKVVNSSQDLNALACRLSRYCLKLFLQKS